MIFEGNEPRFSISCTPEAVCETLGNSRSTNSFRDPVYYIRNNGRRVIVTFHGENPPWNKRTCQFLLVFPWLRNAQPRACAYYPIDLSSLSSCSLESLSFDDRTIHDKKEKEGNKERKNKKIEKKPETDPKNRNLCRN